jgi:SEC-C motif
MSKSKSRKRHRVHTQQFRDHTVSLAIRTETEIIAELRILTQSPGFIHAFAYLVFKSNIVTAGEQFTKDDFLKIYDKTALLRTESNLLLALLLSAPVALDIPKGDETAKHISRALGLLEELHQAVLEPGRAIFREAMLSSVGDEGEGFDPLRSGAVMREAFFYGSESAFPFQYLDLAKKRYANDAGWLRQNVGFTVDEAVSVISAIRNSLTERLPDTFEQIRQLDPSEWTFLPLFRVDIDDVVFRCDLDREIVDLVIAKFQSNDASYSEIKNISQFNPVNARPLVRLEDGCIYSFLEYSLCECVYEGPFYWICQDKSYLGLHSQSRGNFLENEIEDLLISIFGEKDVYRNVVFKDSNDVKTEADAILVYGDRAFIFQAKSKKLTERAKLGDEGSIESDFRVGVQAAYDQALACIECLKSGVQAISEGEKLETGQFEGIREYYPICVSSEHYPALAHQSRTMLHIAESDFVQRPLVFDIFTIDVIAEMLDKPLYFIDYLVKRAVFLERVIANHELVVLSWYIKKNLHFDDELMVYLEDDVLVELDLAMAVRRMGIDGPAVPKGQLTRFQGTPIQDLLDAVNATDRPEVHRLGELLIGLGSDAAETLNDGMARVIAMTKNDGQQHDMSMGVAGNGGGVTIHCNRLPNKEAMQKLRGHCAIRKYVTKSDRWFGVSLLQSGEPRVMVGLTDKWQFDPAIEAIAGDFRVSSRTNSINAKERKIRVNELCPCGSGKKYKKCHGRN